jgi:hypothetical protein
MQLPDGENTIEMTFDPQELHQTEGVASAAIIVIFVLLLLAANVALWRRLRASKSSHLADDEK